MLKAITLFLCLTAVLFVAACSKTETNANKTVTANNNKPAAATTTPATTTTASAEKIGIPECDEFLAAYENCVSGKVPEAARAQYKTSLDQWRSSWRKLAENPATKGTLAAACKQSAESARASMKSYGCTF